MKIRIFSISTLLVLFISLFFSACGEGDYSYNSGDSGTKKTEVSTRVLEDASENTTSEDVVESIPLEEDTGSAGLAFQPLSGGTCYINGIGSCTDLSVSIPKYIDGYRVTGICDKAFYNCKSLTSIIIPDGVTSIGNYAFHKCTNLVSISMPSSVTVIGAQAFADCESLTNVAIPNQVTRLEFNTFRGCFKLETLTIPGSVTFIADAVLSSNYLENVYFEGTRSQWNAITNYDYYYQFRKFTVHCTDGLILPETSFN